MIDNESGEDITQVALSQILVGSQRAKQDPSDTLLTQILSRGGDALYGAIRKSVDEASDGIGDFGERFKLFVNQAEQMSPAGRGFGWDRRETSRDESDQVEEEGEEQSPRSSAPHVEATTSKRLFEMPSPTRSPNCRAATKSAS